LWGAILLQGSVLKHKDYILWLLLAWYSICPIERSEGKLINNQGTWKQKSITSALESELISWCQYDVTALNCQPNLTNPKPDITCQNHNFAKITNNI
jgi:hypothetical protein